MMLMKAEVLVFSLWPPTSAGVASGPLWGASSALWERHPRSSSMQPRGGAQEPQPEAGDDALRLLRVPKLGHVQRGWGAILLEASPPHWRALVLDEEEPQGTQGRWMCWEDVEKQKLLGDASPTNVINRAIFQVLPLPQRSAMPLICSKLWWIKHKMVNCVKGI